MIMMIITDKVLLFTCDLYNVFVQRYVLPSITKALSTRIRILLNPQRFLSGHGYRPHARIRCIRLTNPQGLNLLSTVRGFESHYVSGYVWTVIPDIFLSGDVTKATPVLAVNTVFNMATSMYALLPILPDTESGYVSGAFRRANSI